MTSAESSPTPRPKVFIGSSTEGLRFAEAIQYGLEHNVEATLWTNGAFGLSQNTLDELIRAARTCDYAVLVLSIDDLTTKRHRRRSSPRDNVIFELGLFVGALGRERTFFAYDRNNPPDLPTDLLGITPATWAQRSDGNLLAAMGPVCLDLKRAMGLF